MNNEDILNKFEQTLFEEGVPEAERMERAQILNQCIENGRAMADKLKAIKKNKKKSIAIFTTWDTLEWGFFMLAVGWILGIVTLHDYQLSHP